MMRSDEWDPEYIPDLHAISNIWHRTTYIHTTWFTYIT